MQRFVHILVICTILCEALEYNTGAMGPPIEELLDYPDVEERKKGSGSKGGDSSKGSKGSSKGSKGSSKGGTSTSSSKCYYCYNQVYDDKIKDYVSSCKSTCTQPGKNYGCYITHHYQNATSGGNKNQLVLKTTDRGCVKNGQPGIRPLKCYNPSTCDETTQCFYNKCNSEYSTSYTLLLLLVSSIFPQYIVTM